MPFSLALTDPAQEDFDALEGSTALRSQFKAVQKCLGFLAANPRHPGLNTHAYDDLKGPNNEKVFEAYAQNHTPGAYRVFFFYGPVPNVITVIAITPHP